MSLPPLGPGSMRGWLLNAQCPAPISPRKMVQGNGEKIKALFEGTTDGWGSTSRNDYLGQQPRQYTQPFSPRPSARLLESNEVITDRFKTTSGITQMHPGTSPRVIRKVHANAPSEVDHPMFGLHDPFRKERLGPMLETSLNSSTFLPPDKSAYSYAPAAPPHADTAHLSFNFDRPGIPPLTIGSSMTEQQSKYVWPSYEMSRLMTPRRMKRPEATLVIA